MHGRTDGLDGWLVRKKKRKKCTLRALRVIARKSKAPSRQRTFCSSLLPPADCSRGTGMSWEPRPRTLCRKKKCNQREMFSFGGVLSTCISRRSRHVLTPLAPALSPAMLDGINQRRRNTLVTNEQLTGQEWILIVLIVITIPRGS